MQNSLGKQLKRYAFLGILLAAAQASVSSLAQTDATPAPPADEPEAASLETTTPSTIGTPPDAAASTSGAPDNEDPIAGATTGRPSLDYEPSESISEDRSVSFPVDI